MGREIRRVAPDWVHPSQINKYNGETQYKPLFDESYESARAHWLEGLRRWDLGEIAEYQGDGKYEWKPKRADMIGDYWEDAGDPPQRDQYRPNWTPEEMTAYQVYETVSEGTPISPVLLTREALLDWLMNVGTRLGIGRDIHLSKDQAERFIEVGGAPSMVFASDVGLRDGVEAL